MQGVAGKYGKINKSVVRLIVSLVVLGVINAIISSLPGIGTFIPNWPISIAAIVSVVIGIIMIGIVLRFGKDFAEATKTAIPSYPEMVVIISNLILIGVIWIAYTSFDSAIIPFMSGLTVVYPLVFLAFAILPGVRAMTALVNSIDKWSDLIQGKLAGTVPADGSQNRRCPECAASIPTGDRYCGSCGSKVS